MKEVLDKRGGSMAFPDFFNPTVGEPELRKRLNNVITLMKRDGESKQATFKRLFYFFTVEKAENGGIIVSFNRDACLKRGSGSYSGGDSSGDDDVSASGGHGYGGGGGRGYGGGGGRGNTRPSASSMSRSAETVKVLRDLFGTNDHIHFTNLFENESLQNAMFHEYGERSISDEETFLEIVRVLGYKFSPSTGYVTDPESQTRAEAPSPETQAQAQSPETRALCLRVPSPSPDPELD